MTDVFSKTKRSEVMSRIRSHGNRETELRLISILRSAKITGWRRRQKLIGRPDFVFRAQRIAIFVDGCFWHGCRLHGRQPRDNAAYWAQKLAKNAARDRLVARILKLKGWKVIRIWEHDLKNPIAVVRRLERVLTFSSIARRWT